MTVLTRQNGKEATSAGMPDTVAAVINEIISPKVDKLLGACSVSFAMVLLNSGLKYNKKKMRQKNCYFTIRIK
jgi:hypothetical protein